MRSQRPQTVVILFIILLLILAIWLVYIFFLRSPGISASNGIITLLSVIILQE